MSKPNPTNAFARSNFSEGSFEPDPFGPAATEPGLREASSTETGSFGPGPDKAERFRSDHLNQRFAESVDPELMAREAFLAGQWQIAVRRRDYRTGALTVGIITLSLMLGWMVGRAGWSMAVHRAEVQIPALPNELGASQVTAELPTVASQSQAPITESNVGSPITTSSPAEQADASTDPTRAWLLPPNPAAKPKKPATEADDGLVMFEGDKVIFRTPQPERTPQTVAKADGGASTAPGLNSATPTSAYLLKRVLPEYPEPARQLGIQGPVVLTVLVARDGSVQDVKVSSGHPGLVDAAVEAVKQWRFQPQRVKGNPAEFETRITVNFTLP